MTFHICLLDSTEEDMKTRLIGANFKNSQLIKNNFLTSRLVKPCARVDYCRFLRNWKEILKDGLFFLSLGVFISTLSTISNKVQIGLKKNKQQMNIFLPFMVIYNEYEIS